MDDVKLTEGALQVIMKGGEVEHPIMQVLGSKRINSGSADKERFRILLSDGVHTISFAMLTTQINESLGQNGLEPFTIVKLKKYITSVINNAGKGDARILLILELDVVKQGEIVGHKIGNPTPLSDKGEAQKPPTTNGTANMSTTSVSRPSYSNGPNNMSSSLSSLENQLTHPITSLSPYHNKWVIKARVMNKSAIRTWSNSRGEGKLFSMDLADESGEIRCTAFKEMVDKYYDFIKVDKVYYISKCQLKPANKQFSSLKNDYEMTMTNETVIQECMDADDTIPQTKYDFVPIEKIAHIEVGTLIDVIGVCKSVTDLQTIVAKSSGRELKKKEVTLVDTSNTAIVFTLWGTEAENFNGAGNPVIVVKGAKVGEFGGGKNLSSIVGSHMRLNPEMPECYRIRSWYDSEGNSMDSTNISARTGLGGFNTPWMSFREVQDEGLGNSEKGDYYQVMGTVLLMRSENMFYKACPTEECNKKVVDLENGMFRCEKCNREYPNFKYRLLVTVNVGDWSGNQWISMFSSEAEKMLGMTAQEVGDAIEQNPEAANEITNKVNFKQFIFKCRAKMENYNDETRLKTVAVRVDKINYEEYNSYLVERIQQLTNITE